MRLRTGGDDTEIRRLRRTFDIILLLFCWLFGRDAFRLFGGGDGRGDGGEDRERSFRCCGFIWGSPIESLDRIGFRGRPLFRCPGGAFEDFTLGLLAMYSRRLLMDASKVRRTAR